MINLTSLEGLTNKGTKADCCGNSWHFLHGIEKQKKCFLCVQFLPLTVTVISSTKFQSACYWWIVEAKMFKWLDVAQWQIAREAKIICGRKDESNNERNLHIIQHQLFEMKQSEIN